MFAPSLFRAGLLVAATAALTAAATDAADPPVGTAAKDAQGLELFEQRIRPVLVERCYECHSAPAAAAKKLKGELRLDTRAGTRAGGESGPAVVPGDPSKSLLLAALKHESFRMPPSGKLPEAVIADFAKWIELGAPDPREGAAVGAAPAIDVDAARRSHWAFRAPQKSVVPTVKQSGWPRGDLDRFVLAKLEAEGLRPVAPAAPRDLLRRVHLDLIGLPPTPDEADAFLGDASPDPLEKVVDRLLDSPHYGERWARHWLDVARYAEDQALANARDNPHAFRYRDWVVQALRDDMPYDRFLKLQLAGDLLPDAPQDHFVRLGGLGFQGLGQLYHRGNFPEQVMADELDDRIDTVSRGLLGLTVACARCHDHKYDPIPTRDYYALAAAYQGSSLADLPLASPAEVERHKSFVEETKRRETGLAQSLKEHGQRIARERLRDLRPYLVEAWRIHLRRAKQQTVDEPAVAAERRLAPLFLTRWTKFLGEADPGKPRAALATFHKTARESAATFVLPTDPAQPPEPPEGLAKAIDDVCANAVLLADELDRLDAAHREALAAAKSDVERKKIVRGNPSAERQPWAAALLTDKTALLLVDGPDVVALLDPDARRMHDTQRNELESFRKSGPAAPLLVHGVKGGGTPMRIHLRGNVERKGDLAPPGFLQVLSAGPPSRAPTDANAAASNGASPTPAFTRLELATAIASRDNPLTARVIVNRIWHLHFGRGLVATPSNFGTLGEAPSHPELLDWLAVTFMDDGWSLKNLHRRIVLSQTYRLSSSTDAAHAARDPENRLLGRWTPRRLDFEAWRDSVLAVSGRLDRTPGGPSTPLDQHVRRTLYSKISRSRIDPTLATFDFPDANVSSEQRSTTTVAQQQLFALNSPFLGESAKAFAARVQSAGQDDAARIVAAYRLAYGREPSDSERAIGLRYLSTATTGTGAGQSPWERYAHALLASNEFAWLP